MVTYRAYDHKKDSKIDIVNLTDIKKGDIFTSPTNCFRIQGVDSEYESNTRIKTIFINGLNKTSIIKGDSHLIFIVKA